MSHKRMTFFSRNNRRQTSISTVLQRGLDSVLQQTQPDWTRF